MNEFVKRNREERYAALIVIMKAFTGFDLNMRRMQVRSVLTGAGGRTVGLDIVCQEPPLRLCVGYASP